MFRGLTPFGNKAWRLGTRPRSVVSAGLDFISVSSSSGRRDRKQGQGKHT